MKAAVLYEQKAPLIVEEVEYVGPRDGEVLVQLAASGVCHSDLHFIDGQGAGPDRLPVIMGHEGAGVVLEVGPGVKSIAPGDHVVLSWVPQCGTCHYCTIGRPNLCTGRVPAVGERFRHDGAEVKQWAAVSSFAEVTVVSEAGCVKIREDAPLDKASLVGCGVMTGVGAVVNTAKVRPGSTVLVIGCGGVGLNVIQGAVLSGAYRIIAADVAPNKLQYAEQFGATDVINAKDADVIQSVMDLTNGMGVDYAFEVISTAATIRQAFDALAAGGVCTVVGIAPPGTEVSVPTQGLLREKVLQGSIYGSARMRVDIPRLIDLYMDGKLKLDELVTQSLPIGSINKALDDLRAGAVARSVITY